MHGELKRKAFFVVKMLNSSNEIMEVLCAISLSQHYFKLEIKHCRLGSRFEIWRLNRGSMEAQWRPFLKWNTE